MAYVVYIYEATKVDGQIERQSECRQKDQKCTNCYQGTGSGIKKETIKNKERKKGRKKERKKRRKKRRKE